MLPYSLKTFSIEFIINDKFCPRVISHVSSILLYSYEPLKLNRMKTLRNKVQLIGNLGIDPEVKQLESGKTVAKISLATSETYKNAEGEKKTDTQWHNLVLWGKTAEIAGNFLKKGQRIAIEGKLVNRSYKDKKGVKRYVSEVVVNEFLMLSPKQESK